MQNILPAINLIFNFMDSLIETLRNSAMIRVGSVQVSYIDIVFVFLIIGFVVTLFWKGAKA